MNYRLLKPNEIIRKTDQARYIVHGKPWWTKVTGHGFKVKDCMCGHQYRRKVSCFHPCHERQWHYGYETCGKCGAFRFLHGAKWGKWNKA